MSEHQTDAQNRLMALINNPALGGEIGRVMAEIAIELADAKLEAKHWRNSFTVVQKEIKVLAAVLMHEKGERRLVVTLKALQQIPPNLELHVAEPEPGVRIYEMRERMPELPGSPFVLPEGNA